MMVMIKKKRKNYYKKIKTFQAEINSLKVMKKKARIRIFSQKIASISQKSILLLIRKSDREKRAHHLLIIWKILAFRIKLIEA